VVIFLQFSGNLVNQHEQKFVTKTLKTTLTIGDDKFFDLDRSGD
jgi:hypothetical protein